MLVQNTYMVLNALKMQLIIISENILNLLSTSNTLQTQICIIMYAIPGNVITATVEATLFWGYSLGF